MATKKTGTKLFELSGVVVRGTTAVSDFNTDGMDMTKFNSPWIIYVSRTLTTGSPTWTIQHSNDNVSWYDYDSMAVNVTIPNSRRESVFLPNWVRLKYTSNSATGFVTMSLVRIND